MSGSVGLILIGIVLIAAILWAVLSGQRREAAFKQVARDLGGRYLGGGKVEAPIGKSTASLQVSSTSDGKHTYTYTRMHAPFENRDAFELSLSAQGAAGRVQSALVAQAIQTGAPEFDRLFTIWSNNAAKARNLLADARIRQLIQQQPGIKLTVTGRELQFETKGAVRDVSRLESLFDLFRALLGALER